MDGITDRAQLLAPLHRAFRPTLASVSEARHEIADYLDLLGNLDRSHEIQVAVTEAVKNAVEHAFPDADEGEIVLDAEVLVPDTLRVSVSDDGIGITPDLGSQGLGLGLSLIGRFASDFEVAEAQPHGTRISMLFRL